MNTITRRIAAGAALLAAPALIALGTATMSHAEATVNNSGPNMSQPSPHPVFPGQSIWGQPGTPSWHHSLGPNFGQ
jgi:hypothetical protein